MKCKKSLTAGVICSVIAFSSLSVSAEWVDAGYDTTTPPNYYKIQNEVLYGKLTSNQKYVPVAPEKVEWRNEGYELEYPHAGYQRLHLEGNAQVITRYNGLYPQWETRYRDFMWEMCGDHTIWQRQQTNIPGIGWRWDFGNPNLNVSNFEVFVPTNRKADVKVTYSPMGIGSYDLQGHYIADYEDIASLYSFLGNDAYRILDKDRVAAPDSFFSVANLSARDANGEFAVTDDMIAAQLGTLIMAKNVTGPSYYGEPATKNVASAYLTKYNEGVAGSWYWDNDIVTYGVPSISWTAPQYEMEEPYYYYQYLTINGLTFDGKNDTPRIFRYLGHPMFTPNMPVSKATPKVEWRYVFSEAAAPYNVIEVKYLDGKMAYDEYTGLPYYRTTGEFGNAYIKVTSNQIQLWVKDERGGNVQVDAVSRTDANYDGFSMGYTSGSAFIR